MPKKAEPKKKAVDDVAETPQVEAIPAGHVKVVLMDEHERGVQEERIVEADRRPRILYGESGSYVAVRQNDDGAWLYRKQTH